jgi:zinc protease
MTSIALLCGLVGLAQAADPAPKIDFEMYTLPNGLEVILAEDHRLPLVSINTWYHVGASNEAPGKSGFAHLFEHIMFQGSRNVPEDQYFPILEGAGAPMVNGTTDFDRTNYFQTVPSNRLELGLWLESDRMGFLLDTLTQERLDNQKAVVRKERQQSTENVPYGAAEEQFYKALFPAPHPYNGVVIGSHQDLEAATLEDVKSFFKTYYAPNNATLAIVGDFKVAEAKALVEKYYGTIPKGAEPAPLAVKTEPVVYKAPLELSDDVELPKVFIGWVTSKAFQPGDAELQLGARVLAEGKSSRMHQALVEKQQVAQSVKAYQYPLTLGSVFVVEILGKPGQKPADLEKAAWAVIEKMNKEGPTPAELQGALKTWQASTLRGLEDIGGFGGKADTLNYYHHHLGKAGYLPEDFARMAAVTPAAVQSTMSQQLRGDNRVLVFVTPAPKGGAK